MSHREYVLELVAGIIERGDDQLVEGKAGRTYSDANWVVDLLLGEMGYVLHITEDHDVEIWPKDLDSIEPGDQPIRANHYRIGEVDGKWYHTKESYRAAVAEHNKLADAMDTLDQMAQR